MASTSKPLDPMSNRRLAVDSRNTVGERCRESRLLNAATRLWHLGVLLRASGPTSLLPMMQHGVMCVPTQAAILVNEYRLEPPFGI